MPSAMQSLPLTLPALYDAISGAEVLDCTDFTPFNEVKQCLLDACEDLLNIESTATLWKTSRDRGPNRNSNSHTITLAALHKRLTTGRLALSPLKAHSDDPAKILKTLNIRTGKTAINRPLEDFEDLYYAILAKIKDIHQHISLRIANNFSQLTDPISTSGGAEGAVTVPHIAQLHDILAEHWDNLNEAPLVKALDDSVRRSRVKHLHLEVLSQLRHGLITCETADELVECLYDPEENENVQGLAWIGGWAPSMIGAWLGEKYRVSMGVESEEKAKLKMKMAMKKKKNKRKAEGVEGEGRKRREVSVGSQTGEVVSRESGEIVEKQNGAVQEQSMEMMEAQSGGAVQEQSTEMMEVQNGGFVQEQNLGMAVGQSGGMVDPMVEAMNRERELQDIKWEMRTRRVEEYRNYLRSAVAGNGMARNWAASQWAFGKWQYA